MVAFEPVDRSDWWPCACVKRKKGVMTHIKMHPPKRKKCRVCGCTQAAARKIEAEEAGRGG